MASFPPTTPAILVSPSITLPVSAWALSLKRCASISRTCPNPLCPPFQLRRRNQDPTLIRSRATLPTPAPQGPTPALDLRPATVVEREATNLQPAKLPVRVAIRPPALLRLRPAVVDCLLRCLRLVALDLSRVPLQGKQPLEVEIVRVPIAILVAQPLLSAGVHHRTPHDLAPTRLLHVAMVARRLGLPVAATPARQVLPAMARARPIPPVGPVYRDLARVLHHRDVCQLDVTLDR